MTREEINRLHDEGKTTEEIQAIIRARGGHLCADCKHGIFRFLKSMGGQPYASHYCELHPDDGMYLIHINYLSEAYPNGKCHFEPKTNK